MKILCPDCGMHYIEVESLISFARNEMMQAMIEGDARGVLLAVIVLRKYENMITDMVRQMRLEAYKS